MKNNIAELIKEYHTSDSVVRRNEIQDTILNQAVSYIELKYSIDIDGERRDWISDEYHGPEHGDWTVTATPNVIKYQDSWQYGGYSECDYIINPEEIDDFDPVEYRKKVLQSHVNKLTRSIQEAERLVESRKVALDKFKKENDL
jgi:hypothetical protein